MNFIGRLVTRGHKNKVDLMIGMVDKKQTFFKPNHIYQLEEVLGEIIIKDMGPSAIQDKQGLLNVGWFSDISHIVSVGGNKIILTADEVRRGILTKIKP